MKESVQDTCSSLVLVYNVCPVMLIRSQSHEIPANKNLLLLFLVSQSLQLLLVFIHLVSSPDTTNISETKPTC